MFYSQHKEEETINKYLLSYFSIDPKKETGTYIDIGGGNPIKLSNTYYYYKNNWKGIIIEPHPRYKKEILKERPNDIFLPIAITDYNGNVGMCDTATVGSSVGDLYTKQKADKSFRVDCVTMNELIKKYPNFAEPDFVTIDIESNEGKLLSKCDFEIFKPKIIVIEYWCRGIDKEGNEVDRMDYRSQWEHYLTPYYTFKEEVMGNAIYVRKTEPDRFIPQYEPLFNNNEDKAVANYIKGGGWLTEFDKTKLFAEKLSIFLDVKHCIPVCNGTISLCLALMAMGIKPGDKVIVPALTMIATANAVKFIGAEPIFVDVSPENLCLDIDKVMENIHSVMGVIYVSLNGRWDETGKVEYLIDYCKEHNIAFIEDAAQSFGSKNCTGMIGKDAPISSFSLSTPKIITTGQGAFLTTNDDELALKLKRLKDFGREEGGNDVHDYFGINAKFTDVQAVIGIQQWEKMPERISKKNNIYRSYYKQLKDVKEIEFIPTDLSITCPWFMDIFVEDRSKLAEYLKENKIGVRPIYSPLYRQKAYEYKNLSKYNFPVTEKYANRGLWLPSSLTLKEGEIDYICEKISEYYRRGK